MACCQKRRDNLAAVEGDLYPANCALISPCGLGFYVTRDGALTIIDKKNMVGDYFRCDNCWFENYVSLYIQPTLYASYDGKTKYPVKAHRKMLNLHGFAQVYQYEEPNFGTFVNGWCYQTAGVITKFIMYCPMKNIYAPDRNISILNIDDKVAVCFVTHNDIIIINSDCEILETVCVLESEPGIFKIPGGYLECVGDVVNDPQNLIWTYTSKALNTKAALASQEAN